MIDSGVPLSLTRYSPDAAPLWLNVIGATAGVLGLVSHLPQVWRLWVGREHVGLSALSCVLNTLTTFTWFVYGLGVGSAVQAVTNGLALAGALGILSGLVALARSRVVEWLPALMAGLLAVAGAAAAGGAVAVGWLAGVITLSMAVPQVTLLIRRRREGRYDARGVSGPRWALSVGCNLGWASYALFTRDPAIGVTATTMTVLSVAVLVLCRSPSPAARPELQDDAPVPTTPDRAHRHRGDDETEDPPLGELVNDIRAADGPAA